jgi:hypothetical protein
MPQTPKMTFFVALALVMGVIGIWLGIVSLRFWFELILHLPDVREHMREESDKPQFRMSRIWEMYRSSFLKERHSHGPVDSKR